MSTGFTRLLNAYYCSVTSVVFLDFMPTVTDYYSFIVGFCLCNQLKLWNFIRTPNPHATEPCRTNRKNQDRTESQLVLHNYYLTARKDI